MPREPLRSPSVPGTERGRPGPIGPSAGCSLGMCCGQQLLQVPQKQHFVGRVPLMVGLLEDGPCSGILNPNLAVFTGSGQQAAVGVEGHGEDHVLVAANCLHGAHDYRLL